MEMHMFYAMFVSSSPSHHKRWPLHNWFTKRELLSSQPLIVSCKEKPMHKQHVRCYATHESMPHVSTQCSLDAHGSVQHDQSISQSFRCGVNQSGRRVQEVVVSNTRAQHVVHTHQGIGCIALWISESDLCLAIHVGLHCMQPQCNCSHTNSATCMDASARGETSWSHACEWMPHEATHVLCRDKDLPEKDTGAKIVMCLLPIFADVMGAACHHLRNFIGQWQTSFVAFVVAQLTVVRCA